jgi:hypothetical protein
MGGAAGVGVGLLRQKSVGSAAIGIGIGAVLGGGLAFLLHKDEKKEPQDQGEINTGSVSPYKTEAGDSPAITSPEIRRV